MIHQNPTPQGLAAARRQRAEARLLEGSPQTAETLDPVTARPTLDQLQVDQIELELQNEELQRLHAEIDISRARYFELYDLAPVGYLTVSGQGKIVEGNFTAARLLGVSRHALVQQPFTRFILPADQDRYCFSNSQLFERGIPQVLELRMLGRDGIVFQAQLDTSTTVAQDGSAACQIMLSDVTARKQLELQNRQLQKSESLGRMAESIAHHFNNQLQAVMISLEMAIEELPQNPEVLEVLAVGLSAARKAAEVSALMFTYIGQNHHSHALQDFSEICHQQVPILRAMIPQLITLETEFPSPGPTISANANQIHQLLSKLVTHALEAGGKNPGRIHLAVKTVPAAEIPQLNRFPPMWQAQASSYACLEVADASYEFTVADFETLFDPFLESKSIDRGLGLPVVLGIVCAHDGVLTVASELDPQKVFRVFFPISTAAALPKPLGVPLAVKPASGRTLLLVEDSQQLRDSMLEILDHLGFHALAAENGIQALEIFQQHREQIGCVLSDVNMPQMNGWELISALRCLAPGFPVILSSGYGKSAVLEGQHPEQPHAFLAKPYTLKELGDTLRQLLPAIEPGHQGGNR